MLRYGLTGGIASGKSTVAAMLRAHGFPVLEADQISHALIAPGGASYDNVVAAFGREILDDDGRINHQRLAALVFHDRGKLTQLNALIHPLVEKEVIERFAALEQSGHIAAFVEAALIFEAGLERQLDGVVVVWSLPEQQLARLIERGMSEDEARRRIIAQMPVEQKLALATQKIDCSGSMEKTREQVDALAAKLRPAASAK